MPTEVELTTVWVVYKNASERGGLGPRIGAYSSKDIATIMAEGECTYADAPGHIVEKQALLEHLEDETVVYILDGDRERLDSGYQSKLSQLRTRAQGKLTALDKLVLGLK